MKTWLMCAVAACLLYDSAVRAQTLTEQLQRAIYTQATLGDIEGAIRMYQQVIATAPAGSEVRTQAQRMLEAAEAYRREGHRPVLATFDGRAYRHMKTGVTFNVPAGWKVGNTGASSDNGEMVTISAANPDAFVAVWLKPYKGDAATIKQDLYAAPLLKMQARGQEFEHYLLREGSVQRAQVGGREATAAVADYLEPGTKRPMVELMTWVYTEKSHVFFFARTGADDADRLKLEFDGMVLSAAIP